MLLKSWHAASYGRKRGDECCTNWSWRACHWLVWVSTTLIFSCLADEVCNSCCLYVVIQKHRRILFIFMHALIAFKLQQWEMVFNFASSCLFSFPFFSSSNICIVYYMFEMTTQWLFVVSNCRKVKGRVKLSYSWRKTSLTGMRKTPQH